MIKMPLEDFRMSVYQSKFAYREGTRLYNAKGRKIGRITPDDEVILRIPS